MFHGWAVMLFFASDACLIYDLHYFSNLNHSKCSNFAKFSRDQIQELDFCAFGLYLCASINLALVIFAFQHTDEFVLIFDTEVVTL